MAIVPWIRRAAAVAWLMMVPPSVDVGFAQTASVPSPGPSTVKVGDRAPDFSIAAGDGRTYALAGLHGKKALVLVVFRGTW